MNQNIFKRNELLAKRVIAGLKSRNMNGYYCTDRASALAQALALIPEGSSVTMGGAMSAHEIGLVEGAVTGTVCAESEMSIDEIMEELAEVRNQNKL